MRRILSTDLLRHLRLFSRNLSPQISLPAVKRGAFALNLSRKSTTDSASMDLSNMRKKYKGDEEVSSSRTSQSAADRFKPLCTPCPCKVTTRHMYIAVCASWIRSSIFVHVMRCGELVDVFVLSTCSVCDTVCNCKRSLPQAIHSICCKTVQHQSIT